MVTVGLLICVLASLAVVLLLMRPKGSSLETVFLRMSWLPPIALLAQVILWPLLLRLSYAAVLPPLLTGIASLFLGVMGATLVAASRQRGEPGRQLLRATLIASIPGVLLLAYMMYGLFAHLIRRTR